MIVIASDEMEFYLRMSFVANWVMFFFKLFSQQVISYVIYSHW